MFFKKAEGEEDNSTYLNLKKRIDAWRETLDNNRNFTMKKFNFKNKHATEYKLGACLDTEEDMKKLLSIIIKVIASCNVIGEDNIAKNYQRINY